VLVSGYRSESYRYALGSRKGTDLKDAEDIYIHREYILYVHFLKCLHLLSLDCPVGFGSDTLAQ
jgi:hypothetical protein